MAVHGGAAVAAQPQANDDAQRLDPCFRLRVLHAIVARAGLHANFWNISIDLFTRSSLLFFSRPSFLPYLFRWALHAESLFHLPSSTLSLSFVSSLVSLSLSISYSVLYTLKAPGIHNSACCMYAYMRCPQPGRPELELHHSGRTGSTARLLPGRCSSGQRTNTSTTSGSYSVRGRPLWGLRPLRGQCRDQWSSMWGLHLPSSSCASA